MRELLHRVQQEGQEVQGGEQRGQMPLAMAKVVFEMIALGLHDVVAAVLDVPAGPAGLGEPRDAICRDDMGGDPGVVVDRPALAIRGGELEPVDLQGVVPVAQGNVAQETIGVGEDLAALTPDDPVGCEETGAGAALDPFGERGVRGGLAHEEEIKALGASRLAQRLAAVEVVAEERHAPGAVVTTPGGEPALGGRRFAVLLVVTILGDDEFRRKRQDIAAARRHHDRRDDSVLVACVAVAVCNPGALGTMDGVGMMIGRAVQGDEQLTRTAGAGPEGYPKRIDAAGRVQGLEDLRKEREQVVRRHRIEQGPNAVVRRDVPHAKEGVGIALPFGPLHRALIGQKRRALRKEHAKGRQRRVFQAIDAILPRPVIRGVPHHLPQRLHHALQTQGLAQSRIGHAAPTHNSPALLYRGSHLLSSPGGYSYIENCWVPPTIFPRQWAYALRMGLARNGGTGTVQYAIAPLQEVRASPLGHSLRPRGQSLHPDSTGFSAVPYVSKRRGVPVQTD